MSSEVITIFELNDAGEKPLVVQINGKPLELTYDQSQYTPELERKMDSEMRNGRAGHSLAILLMKLLLSWKVSSGPKDITLPARPGKFELEYDADGRARIGDNGLPVFAQVDGKPVPEKPLVIPAGSMMPLNERVLDQCLGIFAMGKIVRSIMEDQRPNDTNSTPSDDSW